MKKLILAVIVALSASTTFAQKGKNYLPVSKDWAIGIDATPFLSYFGNLIGGQDGNVAPTWNNPSVNQVITGKYFVKDDMAYRASLRVGFGTMNNTTTLEDDASTTTPVYPELPLLVEDNYRNVATNIGISAGFEKRRGFGRLQGYYGAEAGIAIGSTLEKYTYGNTMTTTGATSTDFGNNITTDTYDNTARITDVKSGVNIGFGLRAFIGAEYFVLPKISMGGEFGWGLAFTHLGAGSITTESTDGSTIGIQTLETDKTNSIGVDTDSNTGLFGPAGSLRMTFHF
ncbi:MAG: hypothetical protein P8N52_01230 [Crocinitomicaceae bacterium]|nr:hypothetical protein [Crocinitomicaceae bacterium]